MASHEINSTNLFKKKKTWTPALRRQKSNTIQPDDKISSITISETEIKRKKQALSLDDNSLGSIDMSVKKDEEYKRLRTSQTDMRDAVQIFEESRQILEQYSNLK